ncbi:RNA-binding domain-containing protein [Paenibacillus sp. HB172176]|uniref:RNA-binding domain-containing protein n=1 Tax=Paenibacillus sp. HB172176 TaxID=2493690 RepID=UPI001439906F|nr:RNA-binding domain-containing protein [Paenibacillus sp. HB172176]
MNICLKVYETIKCLSIKFIIIAFANTNGGSLYIGIDDSGSVVGVNEVDDVMLRVTNGIRDSIKPDVTLFVTCEMEVIEHKSVIKVNVQKGSSSPYYLASKEGVYVRQGASSVPATDSAIRKMIKETDGDQYEDLRSLIQELTFHAAEKEFAARKVPFGASQQISLKLMSADGIYSNLGLLLSDQCRHSIKLAVFEGVTKAVFKDRREFVGSLLTQLDDAYVYMDRYNRTRAEFEGLHRIDKRDYPVKAVREALLNAVVHRDYSFSGSLLISVFDDRLEFVSIGGLVRGITYDDIMLGISVARNEKLANIFYRLSLVEAYGTGMPKIMQSYSRYSVTPTIEISDNAFKITLPNTNAAATSDGLGNHLSDHEQLIVEMFANHDSITRKEVEQQLSISQAMAVRVLKGLCDKNILRSVGGGRSTRYVPTERGSRS